MSEAEGPVRVRRGLVYILGATVVAGAVGYVIQAIVPAFTTAAEYIAFSVFWSAVYLVVSAVSGLQQEVTRASHPRRDGESGWRALQWFALGAAGACAVIVAASSPAWAPGVFRSDTVALVAALVVATVGYAFIAVLSGAYYGLRNWPAAAGMTVVDAGLRLVAIILALIAGWSVAGLAWAVAIPFAVSFLVMFTITQRRIRSAIAVDSSPATLAAHSVSTVGAALATGVMISGLPLLLGVTEAGLGQSTLAALVLVITLTRAPLVVPILALQSYLIVTFRDHPDSAGGRVLRWGAALLIATAALSAAGAFIGPAVVQWLYAGRYFLEPIAYATIIASAGLTGVLCLTGPAVLAAGRHGQYVAGWAAASATLVIGLALPVSGIWGVLVPLLISPVVGVVVHAVALRTPRAVAAQP